MHEAGACTRMSEDLLSPAPSCRCSLCKGTGAVGWEGKWSHREPCPLCVGKRFVDCSSCGGHFHRPMFRHIHRTALDVTEDFEELSQPTKVISGVLED